jgi:hypothetical protein
MEKSIKVKVKEQEYVVKFPTVGQLLEIEALKMAYTNNTYGALVNGGLRSSAYALDMADCFATFQVMIPELAKDLGIKSFVNLDAFEAKKIVSVYTKQFQPWMVELLTDLYKMEDEAIENQKA